VRKLIAAMKVSLDEKVQTPDGPADWVHGWSDDYELMPQIDACLLAAGMYPGYERYWTGVQTEPHKPNAMTGDVPTPGEPTGQGHLSRRRRPNDRESDRCWSGRRTQTDCVSTDHGKGTSLFASNERRRRLDLRNVQHRQDGRVSLRYDID
jgi:hypothetical protein